MSTDAMFPQVVVLDDDNVISALVEKTTDMKIQSFSKLTDFWKIDLECNPKAFFVDVHLEDGEIGLDGIAQIKKQWPESVVIVMTADSDVGIIGKALSLGADDFIRKPFAPEELRARLMARLQAVNLINSKTVLEFGDCRFDLKTSILQSKKGRTQLSRRESAILEKLVNAGGMVVSKDELRGAAWGDFKVSNNALDRKLHEVRKLISGITDQVEIKSKYGGGLYLADLTEKVETSSI